MKLKKGHRYKIGKALLLIGLLVFIGLFYAQKINLTAADIGRHIRNGEAFVKEGRIVSSNYYSYTQPRIETVNHHWGSGVIYYIIWSAFGFRGLSILNILLYALTALLFFKAAEAESSFKYALFFTILSLPLITSRREVRPEAFSYFFMGLYFYTLSAFERDKFTFKGLLGLIALQAVWVNLHIFFIIGPFLIGAFAVQRLITNGFEKKGARYIILFILVMLACLLNPFGIKGLLEPFMILRQYGYMIVENQSLIFMQKRFPGTPLYWHFELVTLITLAGFILPRPLGREHFMRIGMLIAFGILGWRMIRGIPVFGYFFIPLASVLYYKFSLTLGNKKALEYVCLICAGAAVYFISLVLTPYYLPLHSGSGIGLSRGVNASAAFFKANRLAGPIFNNYDIGGYLIYHLFPGERVFVDNRPEAYSVKFFKETYGPMQEYEGVWAEMEKKYNFNSIFFYRHDLTPHAQPFLMKRLKDPLWAPVFVDAYTLILLKRNEKNRPVISRYELPLSLFRLSK